MISNDSPDAAAGNKNTAVNKRGDLCVPLAAVAIDGTAPEPGDLVDFAGKGKVSRIEADKAYITPTEVNGEAVTTEEEKPAPTPEEEDEAMMRMAEEADRKA